MARTILLLAVLLLTLAPASARATYVVGARQMGSAGAFVATSPDASSLQSNPAAAAADEGLEFQADLGGLSWFGYAPTNSRDDLLFGPLQFDLFAAAKVADGVTLGLALAPVWGNERNTDGTLRAESSSYSLSPSIRIRAGEGFAIAVGARFNRSHFEADYAGPARVQSFVEKGTVYGFGGTAGALLTLLDGRFALGLALSTPMITSEDNAEAKFPMGLELALSYQPTETFRIGFDAAGSGRESAYAGADASTLAFMPISTSASVRLGIEWEYSRGMWLRTGLAFERQRHDFNKAVFVQTGTGIIDGPMSTEVPTSSVISAALGFGFSVSSQLSADIAGILEQPRGSDSLRLRAGLGLVWKQP